MKKKLTIIIIILLIITAFVFNMFNNYKQLNTRLETLYTDKLDLNNKEILVAYFSDLLIKDNYSCQKTKEISERINEYGPDIILFGGDIFKEIPTNDDYNFVLKQFQNLKAKYGKYAILGNNDCLNEGRVETIKNLLDSSDFKILDNTNSSIYLDSNNIINIVGFYTSYDNCFKDINTEAFTIVLSHFPDYFKDLDTYKFDLYLSGHNLNGQIYIPLISKLLAPELGRLYFRKTTDNNKIIDVSNGIGTVKSNIRLFSDPEVVFYKIKSKKQEIPTEQIREPQVNINEFIETEAE